MNIVHNYTNYKKSMCNLVNVCGKIFQEGRGNEKQMSGKGLLCLRKVLNKLIISYRICNNPVSYTHLDVYKRQ